MKNLGNLEEVFAVGGVVKDVPGNVHFDFGLIVHQAQIPSWGAYTYFQTKEHGHEIALLSPLNQEVDNIYPGYTEDVLSKGIDLVPLKKIHVTDGIL